MLIDEVDSSKYLGVNMKKNSDAKFGLSQFHQVEKIINHIELVVSENLKARETTYGNPLLHNNKYSIGIKCVWNYRAVDSILSYLQGSI